MNLIFIEMEDLELGVYRMGRYQVNFELGIYRMGRYQVNPEFGIYRMGRSWTWYL